MTNVTVNNCTHYLKFIAQVQSAEHVSTVSIAVFNQVFSGNNEVSSGKKRKKKKSLMHQC